LNTLASVARNFEVKYVAIDDLIIALYQLNMYFKLSQEANIRTKLFPTLGQWQSE